MQKDKLEPHRELVTNSKNKILKQLENSTDITFIRLYGNIGDDLIYAGTRQLLSKVDYKEASIFHIQSLTGETALISGSGGWCSTYSDVLYYLPAIEKRFKHVIVLPSTFDVSSIKVEETIINSNAYFFAREEVSYNQILKICRSDIALDTAFYFNFNPYKRNGKGTLIAFRQDLESSGFQVPANNNDISETCESLDEFLWQIARHEFIQTDRAHVMIAAALLGKQVEYMSSNYFKVPAIADFSLKGFPIIKRELATQEKNNSESKLNGGLNQIQKQTKVYLAIISFTLADESFILIDDDEVRHLLGDNKNCKYFGEKDGLFWGPPKDDCQAINETNKLATSEVKYLFIAWTSFWWLEHYKTWFNFLKTNFSCPMASSEVVVFNLKERLIN